MNTQELKEKWGKYTDINALVYDVTQLLTAYNHRNTEHGVCIMLDKYFTRKESLIQLFQKSKHYVGNMRIIMHKEFDRAIDRSLVHSFCYGFADRIESRQAMIKYEDADGKTFKDYLLGCRKLYDVEQLKNQEVIDSINDTKQKLAQFTRFGSTEESAEKHATFEKYIRMFGSVYESTISDSYKQTFDDIGSVKIAAGMKTSRAFNRVCGDYGVSTLPKYNSLFAEYSDMVSSNSRTLDVVISLNPLDYLTMSFGKSWSSCHTIDKENIRGAADSHYHGMYCGGTLSYMLDESSIITFVIDKDGDPKACGKIYRNMFHYQNHTLIQGRIYPQGNDGATNLYDTFRAIMQEELAAMLGVLNMWTIKKGRSECSAWSRSEGVHYRDYEYMSDCNMCYLTEFKDTHDKVYIGSVGICPNCGENIYESGHLSHASC